MNQEIESIIQKIEKEKDIFNKARLLHYLISEKQLRIVDLSKKLKIKPSYICHLLRLNQLPPIVIDGYYSKIISISHLFVISRIKDKNKLISLYEKILQQDLTVAETEEAVREILHQTQTKGSYLTKEETSKFFAKLKSKWEKARFKLTQTRIKSKLIIEIKGNLQESTAAIKKILERLTQ